MSGSAPAIIRETRQLNSKAGLEIAACHLPNGRPQ